MKSSTLPAAASGQPTPLVFHWIMTVQLLSGEIETHDGLHTWEWPNPPTRSVMFRSVLASVMDKYGVEQLGVLFYDLTINDAYGAA